ncbi:MAG TPA: LysR substrate-binding domain-containing protein [Rhodanobacteraceae bacterium]
MDLRNLRYFSQVVRAGGFARATSLAHASQPTLSKAVAQLEDELGARLLERDRHGIALTQAGEIVHRHALAMLAQTRSIRDELDALAGLQRGELRLGLPPLGSNILFAAPLARYRERYPHITITLMEHGSRRLEQAVMADEIEVAATLRPHADGLDSQPVCDEPMLAILPLADAHARARRFRLEWLNDSPLILFEQGFALNSLIADACRQRGIAPRETVRSAQVDFILALVSGGGGIALLPRLVVAERTLAGAVAIPLVGRDLRWRLDLAWRRGRLLSPAARAWQALAKGKPATD